MASPYNGFKPDRWAGITRKLIEEHPLDSIEITEVVLLAWDSIFSSKMGTKGFHIGKDIFPKPQIMGFFLHELIPLDLSARYAEEWGGDKNSSEKGVEYIQNKKNSKEFKPGPNQRQVDGIF